MLNNLKARIRKWSDIKSEDLLKLLRWGGSPIDNPKALVCAASKDNEIIGYLNAEPMLLIHSYALKPGANPSDVQKAVDEINQALEVESLRVGANRMLIHLPDSVPTQSDEITLRVVVRTIPQTNSDVKQQLPDATDTPITTWVN